MHFSGQTRELATKSKLGMSIVLEHKLQFDQKISKLEQGLEALETETSPELFESWIITNDPTAAELNELLKRASEKHGRHDWIRLYKAIKIQQDKEDEKSNLGRVVREIVNCLAVSKLQDLSECKRLAQKLHKDLREGERQELLKQRQGQGVNLEINSALENCLVAILEHKNISRQPSVITFMSEFIHRNVNWCAKWSWAVDKAMAAYIHRFFAREGLPGYARAVCNINRYAPDWKHGCCLENMWREIHHLSMTRTPFHSDDYKMVHSMAGTTKAVTDKFKDSHWATDFGCDAEEIVRQIVCKFP